MLTTKNNNHKSKLRLLHSERFFWPFLLPLFCCSAHQLFIKIQCFAVQLAVDRLFIAHSEKPQRLLLLFNGGGGVVSASSISSQLAYSIYIGQFAAQSTLAFALPFTFGLANFDPDLFTFVLFNFVLITKVKPELLTVTMLSSIQRPDNPPWINIFTGNGMALIKLVCTTWFYWQRSMKMRLCKISENAT
ncbi:Transposase for insertion sequence element IS1151 [Trichinella spiralis]|uniref:Transposase for insertion sequence element IS1151 n=1 Tax=Trichinella spiralis TaxID=6334 RepID=A0ABR3KTL3_TRISP